MPIAFNCPSCGKGYNFNDDMGGKQGKCSCGSVINIPVASAPAAPAPPVQQPPVSQMPPMGQPPQQMPPMGQPPMGQPPQQMPPMGQPPQQFPPMGQPPMGQPPQQMPPMGQPPQQFPPMGQPQQQMPPMGQPPMQQMGPPMGGGSPYQTPATGGGYAARDPNRFSTVNLIGHQMYFWNQIAFMAVGALGLIFIIMLLANEVSPTLLEVAFYIFGGACLISSVALGFWITIPRSTRSAPMMITAFSLTVAGTALLWIFYLGDIFSIVLPTIGLLLYFAGGAVMCGGLQTLCQSRQRNDLSGSVTGALVLSIVTGVVIMFVIIATANRWVPNSPGGAKTVVTIYYLSAFGLVAINAVRIMTLLGLLKRTFLNR